jgi:uncharacterized protein YfaS (alpha-2-macroglobulin family)
VSKLSIGSVAASGAVTPIGAVKGSLVDAHWAAGAQRLRLVNDADATAWYGVAQTGFDRKPSSDTRKDGLEITRTYTDTKGKSIDKVETGDEIDVHVRVRSTTDHDAYNIAIVDLLPGGFEPVLSTAAPADAAGAADATDATPSSDEATSDESGTQEGSDAGADSDGAAESEEDNTPAWHSPIGNPESTWKPEYADVREDRVVVYGVARADVQEFIYRIKATNAGKFVIPPALIESLYDRGVQARAPGGGIITVERKP